MGEEGAVSGLREAPLGLRHEAMHRLVVAVSIDVTVSVGEWVSEGGVQAVIIQVKMAHQVVQAL
jgi:hypothetical protein